MITEAERLPERGHRHTHGAGEPGYNQPAKQDSIEAALDLCAHGGSLLMQVLAYAMFTATKLTDCSRGRQCRRAE